MSKLTRIDCSQDQSKRPEAIQYLMNARRKIMRDMLPFTIERITDSDGITRTTITEYPTNSTKQLAEQVSDEVRVPVVEDVEETVPVVEVPVTDEVVADVPPKSDDEAKPKTSTFQPKASTLRKNAKK